MTSILIRADASLSIGSGHVMRSRTLGRELRRRGAAVTFLCRRQPGNLIDLLEQEYSVLALPELLPLAAYEGLQGRELYAAWLGCNQEQDAADCLQALAQAGIRSASWLVVDHYGLDAVWEAQLLAGLAGSAAPKLLAIDDLADRTHQADLLLDQNFFGAAAEERYAGLVPLLCPQLLGPHYALLGPEYAQLHPLVPPRTELRRLLVFFGGVDPANLTGRTLEALLAPELAQLAVDVVLGLHSPHREEVAGLVARRPQTTLHVSLPSLAGLIARADLAIGAGGATSWERACLGLPSLVVAIAENQLHFSQSLAHALQLRLLGSAASVGSEQIRQALVAAIREPWPPCSGHDLSDGWGTARVVSAMLGPHLPLHLRPASAADEALLLRWANDPQVRANSFSPEPIATAEHQRWLKATLVDSDRLLLIASDSEGCPLGQIRFDRQPALKAAGSREALIGLTLDRCTRGQGLATELVRLGLEAMEQRWGLGTEVVAEVLAGNAASQATFARAGFSLDPAPLVSSRGESVSRWRKLPNNSRADPFHY